MTEALLVMLSLLNAFRADHGAAPLAASAHLNTYAAQRCAQQGAQGFISHDGLRPGVGENLAAGYRTAEDAQAGWEGSPGHAQNMLATGYRQVGLAACAGRPPYSFYWVQILGLGGPLPLPQATIAMAVRE